MALLKNSSVSFLFLFLLTNCGYAFQINSYTAADSEYAGTWQGMLDVGGGNSLRIVFHITQSSDSLSATLDSPDQKAFGIPVSSIITSEDSIRLNVPTINGFYLAKFERDTSKLIGTWSQNGMSLPLDLYKKDK